MQKSNGNSIIPTLIIGVLFFIFGFVTWLNGTLIPYLRIACELNTFESLLVAFAFYISYFVMALPSSWILKKTGFKKGMMLGLLIMSIGALIFIPAALTRQYLLFLTGLFIIGTGLSILQTAVNPYITIVGPIESAAKRISIMGICNKIAGAIAPYILGVIILSDADKLIVQLKTLDPVHKMVLLDGLSHRVIVPYLCMSITLVLLACLIYFSTLPEIEEEKEIPNSKFQILNPKGEIYNHWGIVRFPNLVLGVLALFLYVGVEVMAGDTISTYGQSLGIPLSISKTFTSYTLTAMVIGYILGIILIPKYLSQSKALGISAMIGIIFSIFAVNTNGYHSVYFIALLGLANALMWPTIWPLAINKLGKYTKTGSALLIMAIAGGALLPLLYGRLADIEIIGHRNAYWIMVPCYLYILYYSIKGHKITSWNHSSE